MPAEQPLLTVKRRNGKIDEVTLGPSAGLTLVRIFRTGAMAAVFWATGREPLNEVVIAIRDFVKLVLH